METYVTEQYDDDAMTEMTNFQDCLTAATTAYNSSFTDTGTTPNSGVSVDMMASFDECNTEMTNFRLKIGEVINEMRDEIV